MQSFPKFDKDIYACLQCGYCNSVCPTYEQFRWESVTPRGKMFYIKELMERNPFDIITGRKNKIYEKFVDSVYKCTTCASCREVCHAEIDTVEVWETIREWMVRNKLGPLSRHKASYMFVSKKYNPFNESPEKRAMWLPKEIELSKNPDVLFFPGCTASYRMFELAVSGANVLQKLKVPFTILGKDEWCCGSVLLRTGQTDAIVKLAEHMITMAEGRGIKTLVTTCSGCLKTIRDDHPKYVGKPNYEVLHISEFLARQIKEGKLKLKSLNKKITYHDPCHLGRHTRIYDAPRELIKALGCELVEMKRVKGNSRCCGAGGGFKAQYPENAIAIAGDRIREARETNADILTSMCPFCKLNLRDGSIYTKQKMEIKDIIELVVQAVE